MATKDSGSSLANVPQIDEFSTYTIPAEDFTVIHEKEQNSSARSKKKKNVIRKLVNKNSSAEIKAESIEGHQKFDNIEDILSFINGNELEKDVKKEKLPYSEPQSQKVAEKSLGAIRKTFPNNDKYSGKNSSEGRRDEKKKPDMSKPVGHFFRGWFSKNQNSVLKTIEMSEDKNGQIGSESFVGQIGSESFVEDNEGNWKNASDNLGFLQIPTPDIKSKKPSDQFENKKYLNSEILMKSDDDSEETGVMVNMDDKTVLKLVEMSNKIIEVWHDVEKLKSECIDSNQNKIKTTQIVLEAMSSIEEQIGIFLTSIETTDPSVPKKIGRMVELLSEAKKNLKVLQLRRIKQEVFELTNERIGHLDERIALHEELMKYNEMKNNNVNLEKDLKEIEGKDAEKMSSSTLEIISILEQQVNKNQEILDVNENERSYCIKHLEELEKDKEASNQMPKEALEKDDSISETPSNGQLAIEYNPTKLNAEDAKQEPLKESTYELTFHKTSLTSFKTSGKEDLSVTLSNCGLVLSATNWSILEWGINAPHPEAHKKLDELNQRRRCPKEMCKKCKGCGPDLQNCDRCELVTKARAYHDEYRRIVENVDQGVKGKPLRRQAEALAKDAMRSFQNILVPFLVSCIEGETTQFLEHQDNMTVEQGFAAKLEAIWGKLQYIKFSLQQVKIDQDFLVILQKQKDNLKEANVEYADVLDMARGYVSSQRQLVQLWDSNVTPIFSAAFQQTEKDLDSWTKCADDITELINKAFDMIETVEKASKSGEKVEVVDLKCLDTFMFSALSFVNAAKDAVIQKLPLRMMEQIHWAKELLEKIHCVQCRRVILVPGENLVHLEKCSKCKAVRYCNARCQQLQWEDHKDKCDELKKMEKRRKRKASRSGEKVVKKKEKFWEKVLKPLLCRPGVTLEMLDSSLQMMHKEAISIDEEKSPCVYCLDGILWTRQTLMEHLTNYHRHSDCSCNSCLWAAA